ncbi:MAG TPA: ChbG/HpnK family deacetylase [Terriglobales bacterium]|nr:ChbG/HpnK family deacetylase [Terriglobales bacterium]
MRRLIINADDFGLTSGVNRAIVEAHGHGVVTSTTLMANGPAFAEAVRLAQASPRLGLGCHVVLVDGAPVLNPSQVPSLLAHDQVRFRDGLGTFIRRAICRRLKPDQIEAEVTAQIRRIQSTGLAVSHLDTHKHTHMLPQVLDPMLRAAKACGVRALRNPFDVIQLTQVAARPILWKRWLEVGALRGLAGRFRRAVKEAGMLTPDGTLGIVATGALGEGLFHSIVEKLPEGTWEFVCHPGYDDAQLQAVRTRLKESRTRELRLLTSLSTRELLAAGGIDLISYADLA